MSQEKMNILIITQVYFPYYPMRKIPTDFAERLASKGHSVEVLLVALATIVTKLF